MHKSRLFLQKADKSNTRISLPGHRLQSKNTSKPPLSHSTRVGSSKNHSVGCLEPTNSSQHSFNLVAAFVEGTGAVQYRTHHVARADRRHPRLGTGLTRHPPPPPGPRRHAPGRRAPADAVASAAQRSGRASTALRTHRRAARRRGPTAAAAAGLDQAGRCPGSSRPATLPWAARGPAQPRERRRRRRESRGGWAAAMELPAVNLKVGAAGPSCSRPSLAGRALCSRAVRARRGQAAQGGPGPRRDGREGCEGGSSGQQRPPAARGTQGEGRRLGERATGPGCPPLWLRGSFAAGPGLGSGLGRRCGGLRGGEPGVSKAFSSHGRTLQNLLVIKFGRQRLQGSLLLQGHCRSGQGLGWDSSCLLTCVDGGFQLS